MKKFITLLFLSLFVSQINAAMMPIDITLSGNATAISGHDHCQETPSLSYSENAKSSSNTNSIHYCCAIVAILMTSPAFSAPKQVDVYLHSDVQVLASNIAESIYKPPRNYL